MAASLIVTSGITEDTVLQRTEKNISGEIRIQAPILLMRRRSKKPAC